MILKVCKEYWNKHKKLAENLPLIIGAIILLNIYLLKFTWLAVFGWILFLAGLCRIIIPYLKKHKKN